MYIYIIVHFFFSAETIITRECLSSVRSFRTDIPADHYEGCRPAAKDVRLGHYVNNSIHQLDIHRDYYDEVTWCFCYFDHRCNNAEVTTVSISLLTLEIAIQYFISWRIDTYNTFHKKILESTILAGIKKNGYFSS